MTIFPVMTHLENTYKHIGYAVYEDPNTFLWGYSLSSMDRWDDELNLDYFELFREKVACSLDEKKVIRKFNLQKDEFTVFLFVEDLRKKSNLNKLTVKAYFVKGIKGFGLPNGFRECLIVDEIQKAPIKLTNILVKGIQGEVRNEYE
ncbi:hypothetical protein MMJ53_11810 [Enterococcus cecorum]|nr:hypothetical protein [Enterococcus cecorum]MCJ0558815.1 hypothetical protein [Enterococcus cecorum]MCJ0563488.1 hypothetical protein [Enterococcus cecorum]MCJ0565559.1 hypothetical protein [Enterococcus cecorum]MCJ0581597.1 hypothetical protein [Enterococcus cecorum]CAI3508183.1 hypothetical protein CIRMBP1309_02137 [Enterococcus cecorum]